MTRTIAFTRHAGSSIVAVALVCIALTNAHAQTIKDAETSATFANDAKVGPVLVSLGDAKEAAAHGFEPGGGLWALTIFDGSGSDKRLEPGDSTCTTRAITPVGGGKALDLSWLDCSHTALGATDRFDVVVHATLTADHALSLTVEVKTSIPARVLREVELPRLYIKSRGKVAEQVLTYPYVGGWLFRAPLENPILATSAGAPQALPGPLSMQWFSYYDRSDKDAAVLFWGTRDSRGAFKEVIFDKPTSSMLPFRLRHVVPVPLAAPLDNDYTAPFAVVLRVLRGSWFEAARFYRSWALTQPWTAQGPMRGDATFSKLIKDARVFASNVLSCPSKPCDTTGFDSWSKDLMDQRARFGVSTIPQLQYTWHHGPELGESGDWLPIHATVKTNGPKVKADANPWAPYFYNLSYNINLPTFKASDVPGHVGDAVVDHAVKDVNQVPAVSGGSGVEPTVLLCPHTPFMRDYSKYIVGEVVKQSSAEGVYLDVYNVAAATRCYDPKHGHPLGGGDFFYQGLIETLKALKSEMRKTVPQFFVYSEGLDEMMLGQIELGFTHLSDPTIPAPQRRLHLELPPLFETVYGDFHVVTSLLYQLKAPAFAGVSAADAWGIRASYGWEIHSGSMPPTGAFVGKETLQSVLDKSVPWQHIWGLAKSVVDIVKQPIVGDYLMFGLRDKDPGNDAPIVETKAASNDLRQKVYVSAWRSDTKPGLGLLVINWTEKSDAFVGGATGGDMTANISIDPARYKLAAGDYELYEVTASGSETKLEDVALGGAIWSRGLKVSALGARFLRLVPKGALPDGGSEDGGSEDGGGTPDAGATDSHLGEGTLSPDAGAGGGDDGGCGCAVSAMPRPASWPLLLLALALVCRLSRPNSTQ